MAAVGMKEIKRRIKSIESTMQITKAMELVASSKLRRARERAEQSLPYFHELYATMTEIVSANSSFQSIYTEDHRKSSVLLVVIAGDRGLAGGFNGNVFKQAAQRIQELTQEGREISLIPIGKKAADHFAMTKYPILASFSDIAGNITMYKSLDLAELILRYYDAGNISAVEIIFNDYVSPLTQEVRSMKLLPIPHMEQGNQHTEIECEPSPQAVFKELIPQYLSGSLYCAIVDSFAAEQAARRLAMQNATDNGEGMLNDLSLMYNRARQAAITQEITEIVGGANAQTDG